MRSRRATSIASRIALAGALVAVASCADKPVLPAEEQALADTFQLYPSLAESISTSSRVELYEGLPHQLLDRDLYESERKNKPTTEIEDFAFYAMPRVLLERDRQQVLELYADADNFQPYRGAKPCGGFHPDYALQIEAGGAEYLVLFCFGCGEMQTVSSGKRLYCEMTMHGKNEFMALLKKYRLERPEGNANYWKK